MRNFIISVLINVLALFIITKLLSGVSIASWQTITLAAIVLTLIYTFLKPIIIFVTLPINILSLGIFTLFINAGLFYFASKLIDGFIVANFWSAFLAAIMLSIITIIADTYLLKKNVRVIKHYGNIPPRQDL
jgi:putative membrane protein